MTTPWSPARLGTLTGKRIIVTGATNGVGLGTARILAQVGAHVILAVRNTDLGAQRAAEIGGSTAVVELDLADLSSVRSFPERFDGDVDILINNAGALTQARAETVARSRRGARALRRVPGLVLCVGRRAECELERALSRQPDALLARPR